MEGSQPKESIDSKPILINEIDNLNSRICELKESLFQIQDITSTINTKIDNISGLEGLNIPTKEIDPKDEDNVKPSISCSLQKLSFKINELDQLIYISQNIIARQSRINSNLSQIG